jgi:hypothetical protein
MFKLKYLVPLAIGTGLAAFWFTSKKLGKLEFAVNRLVYKTLSITKINFLLDITVKNPGKSPVKLQDIDLNLYYKGEKFASIAKHDLSINVPAKTNFKISDIGTTINTLDIVNKILDALLGDYDKNVLVQGTIKADALVFQIKQTIDLTKI